MGVVSLRRVLSYLGPDMILPIYARCLVVLTNSIVGNNIWEVTTFCGETRKKTAVKVSLCSARTGMFWSCFFSLWWWRD